MSTKQNRCHHAHSVCTNPWPLNSLNHNSIGPNSGVSWGSRNQRDITVGNSTLVSQGKHFAKNQPGHRLASFKFCRTFHIWSKPLVALRTEICRFNVAAQGLIVPPPPGRLQGVFELTKYCFLSCYYVFMHRRGVGGGVGIWKYLTASCFPCSHLGLPLGPSSLPPARAELLGQNFGSALWLLV